MTKIYFNLRSHCATEIEHLRPYPVNLLMFIMYLSGTCIAYLVLPFFLFL